MTERYKKKTVRVIAAFILTAVLVSLSVSAEDIVSGTETTQTIPVHVTVHDPSVIETQDEAYYLLGLIPLQPGLRI